MRQHVDLVRVDHARQPEVEHLRAARRDHDVGALQIAVHDAAFVSMGERVGDLGSVTLRTRDRQRPVADHVGERAPLDELHHDVQLPVGAAHVVDVAHVRVAEPRRVLRFPPQPRLRIGTLERRHLQGDFAAQLRVARGVDVSHPATANETADLVVTDHTAGQHRGRGRLLDEVRRTAVGLEEAIHFGADLGVSIRGLSHERGSAVRLLRERGVEHRLDAGPLLGSHRRRTFTPPDRARRTATPLPSATRGRSSPARGASPPRFPRASARRRIAVRRRGSAGNRGPPAG